MIENFYKRTNKCMATHKIYFVLFTKYRTKDSSNCINYVGIRKINDK